MSKQLTISAEWLASSWDSGPAMLAERCEWLATVERQLRAIADLPHGWDSYGSPLPDVRKLKAGFALLVRLCCVSDFPKPHVNPTPDGGVQFDWEEGPRYFEIVLESETSATYLFCDDEARVEETGGVFQDDALNHLAGYIHRVARRFPITPPARSRSFAECERYAEVVG